MRHATRVTFLALAVGVLGCASCGERAPEGTAEAGEEGAAGPERASSSPAAPPAAIACGQTGDCTLTQHSLRVETVADCACPGCPQPVNGATAASREAAWQEVCGDWAERERCFAPMCPPPFGPLACLDGVCRIVEER